MAALTVGDRLELRCTGQQWAEVEAHLFPGDHDEHGVVLLCGTATSGRRMTLLVRDVIPAMDGIDYVAGTRGYRHLTGEFVTRQLRRARDQGLVYLAVHNHGGRGAVAFSPQDLASHERGYPTLLQVSGQPVGALVVADGAVAGDIWFPEGERRELNRTVVVGEWLRVLTPEPIPDGHDEVPEVFDRQARVFGAAGQRVLGRLRIAVVGAGGVGMLAIQGLARLGVGEIVVVDPERVDETNLPRLPEATARDAMGGLRRPSNPRWIRRIGERLARHKVAVARRMVRRTPTGSRLAGIVGDVADDAVARLLTDCDFIFLAADSALARDVVNQIAYQYLVPTLQIGSKVVVDPNTGQILDVFAVVRSLGTHPGCLRCNNLVDLRRLGEEALGDPQQVANQRYIDDPDVLAPSVITLNSVGTGWALNDFLHYAVALGRRDYGFRLFRNRPVGRNGHALTVQHPHVDPHCHVCGLSPTSAFARGDTRDLPTRLPSARSSRRGWFPA